MNASVQVLNELSETWWSFVAHATWQSAVVGVLILVAVWLMRRRPAPLRYGLLVIALLKFAMPPLYPVSYASHPEARELVARATGDTGEGAGPTKNIPLDSPSKGDLMGAASAGGTPALQAGATRPVLPAPLGGDSPVGTAAGAVSNASDRPAADTRQGILGAFLSHWKTLLLLVHVFGCVVAGLWVVWGIARTRRFAARCEPVEDEALQSTVDRLRDRLGLRRRVRLLTTSEECGPLALGAFRPSIVVPKSLMENMGPSGLETVLAHELAHHRRRDLWLLGVENLLMAVWWFHPVFWALRRTLRGVREDCCDDTLLETRLAERATYCEILLQAAGHNTRPRWAGAALGVSERFHPLGRRFKRCMDDSLKRRARLSAIGIVLLAGFALVVLPGVRIVEGKGEANAAANETAEGLMAYYPLDGDAQDRSGNGNHGTVSGATPTADRAGVENAALHFDGIDDFIEVANSDTVNIHGETSLTLAAWIKPDAAGSSHGKAIVWKWGPRMEEDDQFVMAFGRGTAFFGLSDRASRIVTDRLPLREWSSLVGVYDVEARAIQVYVNGELDSMKRLDAAIRKTEIPLYIGKGETRSQSFAGDIDEVRVYNRALGRDEIQALYKGASFEERMKSVAAQGSPGPPQASQAPDPDTEKEIQEHYAKADPEGQEYIRWTARTFGRSGLWIPAHAYDKASTEEREKKVQLLVAALNNEYGRQLCHFLADAGALKDSRLLPGLIKAAAFHREDSDYDCRPKWMAVAALGRQDDAAAVPTLVPLVDHGNKNTQMWARASLVRLTGQNFGADKQAWGKWWNDAGNQPPIDLSQLKPWAPPLMTPTAPSVPFQPTSTIPAGGTGPRGGVLRFDGEDDFIRIPPTPQLDLSRNFTVSAWVRVDPGCPGEAAVYFRGDGQRAHDPGQLFVYGRKMGMKTYGGQGEEQDKVIAGADLDGGWHLWTGVCSDDGKRILLYKDGELIAETPATPVAYATSAMFNEIGSIDSEGRWGKWGFFKGEIDQLSVWNIGRSPEDIKREFTEGLTGAEPGLAALWTFDEDGQHVLDRSSFKCEAVLGRTPEPDASDPARVPADAPSAVAAAAWPPVPSQIEEAPGELILEARYRHWSRRSMINEPATLWIKQGHDGAITAVCQVPFMNATYTATGDSRQGLLRYDTVSEPSGNRPGYSIRLEIQDGKVLLTRRGVREDIDGKELSVPAGAFFDPNTRPDPYCVANFLFRGLDLEAGEATELDAYDWDNSGEALAAYRLRISHQGKETITVQAGRFEANHYVVEQLTSADTWFKKRAGHVTDFWVLDNGVIVCILRHREPYEVQLLDWKSPAALPGLIEKPVPAVQSVLPEAAATAPVTAPAPPSETVYREPWAMEAELFAPLIRGEGVTVQATENLAGTWSGGELLRLEPRGPASYSASAPVPMGKAGAYTLFLWCSTGPDHGICEMWINGEQVWEEDLYRAGGVARMKVEVPVRLKEGINDVELKITGKNAASSGYAVGMDCAGLK